jgi:Flp pilus assembly protein TadD
MKKPSEPIHTPSSPAAVQSLLLQISSLLASGEVQQALRMAEHGLERFPRNDELHNLAGVCAATLGSDERAEYHWRQAVAINPGAAQTHFNLGRLHAGRRQDREAEHYYRQAIALDAGNVDALSNLGVVLARNRRRDEAEQCYRRAIALDPDNAMVFANLGVLLAQGKRAAEAEHCYRRAIAVDPDDATSYSNLGALLADRKMNGEAEQCYRRAIALDSTNAAAFSNLGILLTRGERYGEAEQCYRVALALDPGNAEAHTNLGLLLEALARDDEAEQCHRQAIELNPNYAEVFANLGNLLTRRRRADEAEACYRQALALDPRSPLVHSSLGVLLSNLGRKAGAEQCFRRAIDLNPDYVLARLNLGFLLLKQGRFSEGWQHHENRYSPKLPDQGKFPHPITVSFPQWRGESLEGKSLLVWPEQGLGDEIQFCRYIPRLKQQGAARITLVCKTPLKRLMETLNGVDTVLGVDEVPAAIAAHDYWTYPLSCPLYCKTDLASIPAPIPYLRAAPERMARWSARLPQDGLRVGLVWKGNKFHDNDSHRSLPNLSALAPLWSVPGVRFVSLQKGQDEDEARTPPREQPLVHLGGEVGDFADTAAVVAQLDLVICVDTAVAHLAGALGKPCWVMLPAYKTDWRWLEERNDSPWYPATLRLFRQPHNEDWLSVIKDIKENLMLEAAQHDAPA